MSRDQGAQLVYGDITFLISDQGSAVYRYVEVSRYWIDTVPVYICTSVNRLHRDITI